MTRHTSYDSSGNSAKVNTGYIWTEYGDAEWVTMAAKGFGKWVGLVRETGWLHNPRTSVWNHSSLAFPVKESISSLSTVTLSKDDSAYLLPGTS